MARHWKINKTVTPAPIPPMKVSLEKSLLLLLWKIPIQQNKCQNKENKGRIKSLLPHEPDTRSLQTWWGTSKLCGRKEKREVYSLMSQSILQPPDLNSTAMYKARWSGAAWWSRTRTFLPKTKFCKSRRSWSDPMAYPICNSQSSLPCMFVSAYQSPENCCGFGDRD